MKTGRVIGKVWADRKTKELEGCRLLVIQPVTSADKACGHPLVVADPGALAGEGDLVVFVTNTDAAMAFPTGVAPVNASVVQLVDSID